MAEKYFGLSAHIFTRDLRVDDNPALMSALESSGSVTTCFAAERSLNAGNPARCENRLAFMSESLGDLSAEIENRGGKLGFYGKGAVKLAEELCGKGVEAIFCTRDYTPYARRREALIESICRKAGCRFIPVPGSLLNEPEDIQKSGGGHYKVFTPFFRKASHIPVFEPKVCTRSNFSREELFEEAAPDEIPGVAAAGKSKGTAFNGGRSEGLRLLGEIERLKNYDKERNFPAIRGTSMLSAHLRFGTVSVREAYHAVLEKLGPGHGLIRQLYWRDFFTHVAFLYPHVFRGPFQKRYESLSWYGGDDIFNRWCEGMTGFPLVDAGMREMNATGYMHNRVRMVAASFLTKDLHIDWRRGERYFASRLTDYDPSVNNGNWQWAASTGCDAQPYFRIFNPWFQQKRYDRGCEYIKRWVPELSDLKPEEIHALNRRKAELPDGYPGPVIDHKTEAQAAKKIYSETFSEKNNTQQNLQ